AAGGCGELGVAAVFADDDVEGSDVDDIRARAEIEGTAANTAIATAEGLKIDGGGSDVIADPRQSQNGARPVCGSASDGAAFSDVKGARTVVIDEVTQAGHVQD